MTAPTGRLYTLDANAFVEAHRKFYAFDICPGYWNALKAHHRVGLVSSIDRIKEELRQNRDPLWQWVDDELPDTFFASTDQAEIAHWFGKAMAWITAQPQFFPQAKAEAAGSADTWLFAHARASGRVLVTLEKSNPATKRKVPLPDLCAALGVEAISPFEMLRELEVRLAWENES